jgi:hypothetical protein
LSILLPGPNQGDCDMVREWKRRECLQNSIGKADGKIHFGSPALMLEESNEIDIK